MTSDVRPGFLVLHGNRSELLRDAIFEWIGQQPLEALEDEVFLVQSNGVAEWLKMALAARLGVCAATRVELPARFLWRAFKQALGREAVPGQSPLDRTALTWRLMALLPHMTPRTGFEPLRRFLHDGDVVRRLQLCQRLASLYDQYQVYRSDWLADWAQERDRLVRPGGAPDELPADQRWQPALWRALLDGLSAPERAAIRPTLHRRFVEVMSSGAPTVDPLPRRVVLFGMSHLPLQTLEAVAALAQRTQVLLAVPNPCRFHWADILDGREALTAAPPRLPLREGRSLAAVAMPDMHLHAHPLLAAWGRQGGDFIRQLDAFDDANVARERFALPRIDLFDDAPGETLLQQVQARVRDLVPLAEHAPAAIDADAASDADRSIVFHVAHSAQREVEILHDQLLALLAAPAEVPLQPRDIVVMVPDIESFAPAIRAVFGQHPRVDARHIPYDIADVSERGTNPLVLAVDWLLRLPRERCRVNDVRDLLDIPAIAARFGIGEGDLPLLGGWIAGAGVRWGLHGEQRAGLGLDACGEQNSWLFGLRRMLLGYAIGREGGGDPFDGIEPYAEVGGLDATLAGALAALVDALAIWWHEAVDDASPVDWAGRLRRLLAAMLRPTDETERLSLGALDDALRRWLEACDAAGFDEVVPLAAVREAWLSGLDDPGLGRRFLGGGVTFCTLMPMRSIPFEVVCLLGMNDGDFPRAAQRSDFDLMGLPGHGRPGDRSRRDDDRQLMLEALLSARRTLYVSWVGRNARDNSELPPSVLVSQLRDYLAAGWGEGVLAPRTTEHPLQPFSRRYFEGGGLFTHAREWRAAHDGTAVDAAFVPLTFDDGAVIDVDALVAFLRQPVRVFFRRRLGVVFDGEDDTVDDHEAFEIGGLEEYQLVRELVGRADAGATDPMAPLNAHVDALQRAGRLPMGSPGRRRRDQLVGTVAPMLVRWQALHVEYPQGVPKLPLRHAQDGVVIDDWLSGLRSDGKNTVFIELSPSRVLSGKARKGKGAGKGGAEDAGAGEGGLKPRVDRLLGAWVRLLAAAAAGHRLGGVLVGRDATLTLQPVASQEATDLLDSLLSAWRIGMTEPLPLALNAGLAQAAGSAKVEAAFEGGQHVAGDTADVALARTYPDFEALTRDGRFETLAMQVYAPIVRWAETSVRVTPHDEFVDDEDEDDADD